VLGALAWHAAETRQPRLAAQLLGAAESARAGVGGTSQPYLAPALDKASDTTKAALGATAQQALLADGRRMSRDAAIALALGEPDPAGASAKTNTSTGPLAKREAEVARLIAEGLSNKQIGTRLLISEHTVDSHIRKILDKLGFSSRTQVAAWIAQAD